jgi:hypothetical protein
MVRFERGHLANREGFGKFLNNLALDGCAIEVGTHLGFFAESLLETWRGKHLLCVDAYWLPLPDEYYESEVHWVNQPDRKSDFLKACERLDQFADRASIVVATSVDAARMIPDESADFIYVDASHLRHHVEADLEAYWPKLVSGGIYAGHDISGKWESEVKPAVGAFANRNGIQTVYTVPGSTRSRWGVLDSWYFRKA